MPTNFNRILPLFILPIAIGVAWKYWSERPTDCSITEPLRTITHQKKLIRLPGGRTYPVLLGRGQGRLFRIEFADVPFPAKPSFKPGKIEDYVSVGYFGDGTRLSVGLVTDSARISTNRKKYYEQVGENCLDYWVYIAQP